MAALLLKQIETGLSPPYDGSEMDDLFPDLAGVAVEQPEMHADKAGRLQSQNKIGESPSTMTATESSEDEQQLMNYLMNKVGHSSESQELWTNNNSEGDDPELNQTESERNSNNGKTATMSRRSKRSVGHVGKASSSGPVEENEPGLNRNALMARLNRQKKKKYLEELETSVKSLEEENLTLKQDNEGLVEKVDKLLTEVHYLKGVIANQSELSSLLQNIGVTGLRLHSSFSHKSPPKPAQSNNGNTSSSAAKSQGSKRKRSCELSECELQSEAESENECELSTKEKARHCSYSDHDYTIPKASKETGMLGVKKTVTRKTSEKKNQRTGKTTFVATRPMTRSKRSVTSKSGQNFTQTVVHAAELGGGEKRSRSDESMAVHLKENNQHMANRQMRKAEMDAGVCLHVSSGNVSLEFCAHCSNRAIAAAAEEEDNAEQLIEVD